MRLKALLALLISLLLTAAAAYFSYTGLFGLLEREVYNPGVRADLETNLGDIVKNSETWHKANRNEAAAFFGTEAARKSVLPQQDAEDIFERARLFGQIQERNPYVLGIRIIAADGRRIHFSTFPGDILRAEDQRVVYRNYGADGDTALSRLSGAMETSGILVLPEADAFAYVLPYTDTFNIKSGFAVFYVRVAGLQAELAKQKLFPLGESVKAAERGLVFGFPAALDTDGVLQRAVEEAWSGSAAGDFITIGKTQDSETYVLLSRRGDALYYGRMVSSSWFVFPPSLKLLLVGIFFCIVYIVFFLAFSIRRDPVLVVGQRIKRLEIELIKEYITEGLPLRERIQEEFERRRPEVKERIRQGLGRRSKKQSELVDAIIDKGWDEIIKVFVRLGGEGQPVSVDMSGIETMLKELLDRWSRQVPGTVAAGTSRYVAPQTAVTADGAQQPESHGAEMADELEELEDMEAAETVKEVEPVEEASAEAEEIEELLEEAEALIAQAPAGTRTQAVGPISAEAMSADEEDLFAPAEPETASMESNTAEPSLAEELAESELFALTAPVVEAEARGAEESAAEELEELECLEVIDEEPLAAGIMEDVSEVFGEAATPATAPDDQSVEALSAEEIQQELLELAGDSSYVLFVNDDDEIPTIPEHLGLEILDELNKEYIEKFTDTAADLEYEELEPAEALEAAVNDGSVGAVGSAEKRDDDGLVIEEPIAEAEPARASAVTFETLEPDDFGATGSLVFEQLEITSPFDEFKSDAGNVLGDKEFRKRINRQSPDQEKVRHEIDELLGEVEFDLFLDSFDFSALKNYNDEEGFLEINETEIRSILEDSGIEIVEPDNLEAAREIPMLSDKERELVEELQIADLPDSGEAVNAEPIDYIEQYIRHCLPGSAITDVVEGELLPVSEAPGEADDSDDVKDVGDGVIVEQDGVFTINRKAVDGNARLDASLKDLADDVLGKPPRAR